MEVKMNRFENIANRVARSFMSDEEVVVFKDNLSIDEMVKPWNYAVKNSKMVSFTFTSMKNGGQFRTEEVRGIALQWAKKIDGEFVARIDNEVYPFNQIGDPSKVKRLLSDKAAPLDDKSEDVVLKGNESETLLLRIFRDAIENKKEVTFDYVWNRGHVEKVSVSDVPIKIETFKPGEYAVTFPHGFPIELNQIGDYNRIAPIQLRKIKENEEKELMDTNGAIERMEKLIEIYPYLKRYGLSGVSPESRKKIDKIWKIISGTSAGKVKVSERAEGSFVTKRHERITLIHVYLVIKAGAPFDGKRMSIEEVVGGTSTRDDEGNSW
jgi:hypothetical protein